MNKLINWLKESNRLKHLKVGVIMFIGLFMIQYIGITIIENNTNSWAGFPKLKGNSIIYVLWE